jgi:hypothetical protein
MVQLTCRRCGDTFEVDDDESDPESFEDLCEICWWLMLKIDEGDYVDRQSEKA